MSGQLGVSLPVLIAVVVVLAGLAGYGWSARASARRRRRALAVLAAAANVIETPPDPDPPLSSQAVPESLSDAEALDAEVPDAEAPDAEVPDAEALDAEQLSNPHLATPLALVDSAEPAAAPLDPEPDRATDSALANLDGGLFASSLFAQSIGNDALRQTSRPAVDDGHAELADGQPASNGQWLEPTSEPPYPGAAYPLPDGSAPSPDYRVKIDLLTGHYYVRYTPSFTQVAAQLWFRTVREAQRAGFTPGD